jgi:ribosomal protein S18 acetylase RimI-like enzyme
MATAPQDGSVLDNPVWHSLNGPLARFVAPGPSAPGTRPAALRVDPEVSVFGALERVDLAGWRSLAEQLGQGGVCALARVGVTPPPVGWQELVRIPLFQLVAGELAERPLVRFEELGPADAQEMFELATETEPGPFLLRTPELGRFIGVRREGRLVAMAGQRFRPPGYVEVSGVCTRPEVRGEGLGTALTLEIARDVRAHGDEPFLHVAQTNETAVRLYQTLGFRIRCAFDVVVVQWWDDGLASNVEREDVGPG